MLTRSQDSPRKGPLDNFAVFGGVDTLSNGFPGLVPYRMLRTDFMPLLARVSPHLRVALEKDLEKIQVLVLVFILVHCTFMHLQALLSMFVLVLMHLNELHCTL